jgi:hypothetical protein
MGRNDLEGRLEMYVCLFPSSFLTHDVIDFILAVCDVEGNFLVVKVSDDTYLPSMTYKFAFARHTNSPISCRACFWTREPPIPVGICTSFNRGVDGQSLFVSFSAGSTCGPNTTGLRSSYVTPLLLLRTS